jgi:S1-C subfamily serine protease
MSLIRLVCQSLCALLMAVGGTTAEAVEVDALGREFQAYSGARLVFTREALPPGTYHDIMPALPEARVSQAALIALREVKKYPRGYLGRIGLEAVGVFAGCASRGGDGYREWDPKLGGYRYYGIWSGRAVAAAYYTDEQLPLTLHHEVFHHVDASGTGKGPSREVFAADDARFQDAVEGRQPYTALRLAAGDLQALKKMGRGWVLREAVSDYAAKNPGEDQAETARYLMSALPDALVQMAQQPSLAGSQRLLHVLDEYRASIAPGASAHSHPPVGGVGPDAAWFVAVALGRPAAEVAQDPTPLRAPLATLAKATVQALQERIQPNGAGSQLVVWGSEDAEGVNWTLRRDLAGFAARARQLATEAARAEGAAEVAALAQLRSAKLLSSYFTHIQSRWGVTSGTRQAFDEARVAMLGALPGAWRAFGAGLAQFGYARLADVLAADGRPLFEEARRAVSQEAAPNRYLGEVDEEIADPAVRAAIRRVQPATVRFASGGSGVNLAPNGLVLTAAHVPDRLGAVLSANLPDGRVFRAQCVAIDQKHDLALLRLDGATGLPFAPIAIAAPAVGTEVVVIGQPATTTPDGKPTGYQPFHVSTGRIRGFLPDLLGSQQLGRTKHDAWTYWGHSGSPLFDAHGAIVAIHNSWDSTTAMRHAVPHQAIVHFLAAHDMLFTWQG